MSRFCAMTGALVALAGVAAANPTVVFSDGPGDVGGGQFTAVTSEFGTFDTFCMEYGEPLDINAGTEYEFEINTAARFDSQGFNNSDELDARTAFIYQSFRDGDIRNILGNQGLTDTEVANAIQIAIWDIEEEPVDLSFHPDFANAQALIGAAEDAINNGAWSGIGNVRVMNNWAMGQSGTEQGARQDTLIIVPLPGGAALAGFGLLGLAAVGRRRG